MVKAWSSIIPLFILFGFVSVTHSQLPMPENPRWEPIVDEVYLQEVSQRIPTDTPLHSVAVFEDVAYVGHATGVSALVGDSLIPVEGPQSSIRRLVVIDNALWAISKKSVWHYSKGNWRKVLDGQYVDLCTFNDDIIIASKKHLYRLDDGELTQLDGERGSRYAILSVATYGETLYVRHSNDLSFLLDGQYQQYDVHDWGELPKASVTRDMLSLGSALVVPTSKGLASLRGTSWMTLTGEDGLCYEDTTSIAEGFNRDYWVGTMRGAIRAVNGEFHYYAGQRWLPNDKVNSIACSDNTAYIATDGGLGIISFEPYTLEKKAAYYKRWMEEWGMKRLGFIQTLNKQSDGSYVRFLSDNDVGWACHYLDALCFEYAVTKDPAVKAEAIDVFNTVKWSEEITPLDGFPARAIHAVSEEATLASTGSAGRPSEWNLTEDGKWKWKGDTSSDEIASQYYTVSIFYELVAEGKVKEAAREHIERMTNHIIDNGWELCDLDGKPTVWARWSPTFINDPKHIAERGLNSGQALSMVTTAQHIVGDTERYSKGKAQLIDWGYPENTLRTKMTFPHYTFFDDRLAFLGYFPLLNYEKDARLRGMYMRSLERSWEAKRFENQSWFNFIYGALTGNECQTQEAVQHLRDYPLESIVYRFVNSHRHDLQVPKGYKNYVSNHKALGPREQGVRRWDRDPLQLDGGGNQSIEDPSSFLDAYWMGRYYGMILAPTTKDKSLLTVKKRNLQLGAEPYTGPQRPKLRYEQ